ncbi:MAG TPA: C4-type zinc ribbon domain-containing protein [Ilumatobacter sp.]|nr:C4-type zinc ribbon domain-containing protein [Ilumatobacter sp.]
MTHPLLELQAADTLTDQLRHRRDRLPEQEQVDAARGKHAEWERRRDGLRRRLDELEGVISRSESDSHAIDIDRARLEKQLKTVIAPREAEALMHEIALLTERRGALDDAELSALEEQADIDDDLSAHAVAEDGLVSAVAVAEEAAAQAAAQIEAQLADIANRHDELRAAVDPALLRRYDQLRRQQMVAAAALQGSRCDGCHLDLSAAELDEVRAAARDGGIADCPHCGRLLVL